MSRAVNKLCPTQNIENKKKELNGASKIIVTQNHPRIEAVIIADFKGRVVTREC